MPQEVDSLEVRVTANANSANIALDGMITRLTRVSTALSSINTGSLAGMANGISRLSNAMQAMSTSKVTDFSRLARGINQLNALDTSQIQRAASALTTLGKAVNSISGVSTTSTQVADLAKAISQLGYKSSTQALENIPKLATAMKQLMATLSSAPKVSQNLIDMTNALAGLARTGASSGKAATSLGTSLKSYNSVATVASKRSFNLAAAIGRLYASYWMVIRVARKFASAVSYASQLTEVQNVVDNTFGDMTSKVEEFSSTSIKQLGMSELAVKQYASRFQAMGTAMGITSSQIGKANEFLNGKTDGYVALSDSMADVSLNLTKLTADIASFYDIDQSEVAEDLQAIFTGQTRPLRQYGLDLTNATLQEWAMKNGLDADISSMSQAQKTMLRYQYVLAQTTTAQGDFARTSQTWANQVRILKQQFIEFGSTVGKGIINAFRPFVQTLNKVMAKVISFSETVLNALGQIFGWEYEITGGGITNDLDDAMEDVADSADDTSSGLGKAASNAKKLKTTLLGIDELNLNEPDNDSDSSSGSSGGSGSGSGTTSADTSSGLSVTSKARDGIFEKYKSSIKSLEALGEYIGDTLTKTLKKINWDKVYTGAKNFGKGLADFLNGLVSPETFGTLGKTLANSLNTVIYGALSFLKTFDFKEYGKSIGTGISKFFQNFDFKALAQTINAWARGLLNMVSSAIRNIDWGSVFDGITTFIGNLDFSVIIGVIAVKSISVGLGKGITALKSLLKNLPTLVWGFLAGIPAKFALLGSDIVASIKAWGLVSTLKGITTGAATTLATLSSKFTKAQKTIAGSLAVFTEFSVMKKAFKDIASSGGNLATSLVKIAGSGAGAFAVLKLICGLSTPVSAVVTGVTALAAGLIGVANAEAEAKEARETQEELELYGDTVENVTEKLHSQNEALRERIDNSNELVATAGVAEAETARTLADEYFNLAEKQNLSNDEREQMKSLASSLVEQFPELADCYDEETGLLNANRDAINEKIDAMLKEAQTQAYVNALTEAYEKQITATSDLDDANQALSKSLGEYATQQEEVEKWEKKVKEARDPQQLSEYNQKLKEAKEKLAEIKSESKGIFEEQQDASAYLSKVESDIDTYTELIKNGYTTAGTNAGEGFKQGFSNTDIKEEGQSLVDQFQHDVLDEHSPSKVFEQFGTWAIEGFVNGFTNNRESTIKSLTATFNSIMDSLTSAVSGSSNIASSLPKSFTTAWNNIKQTYSGASEYFRSVFTSAGNSIKDSWSFITVWFTTKWTSIKDVFKDSKSYFKSAFTSAYEGIKTAFSGLESFFKKVANNIITPIGNAVNGALNGLKWILKQVGSTDSISLWTVPKFATGTGGLAQNTMGIVNDQGGATYKEMIVPPSGEAFIPKGRNVMLPLEKGTKIMPAFQTKSFMNSMGVKHFATGVGSFIDGWTPASSYTGSIADYVDNAKGISQIAIDKFTSTSGWDGLYGKMAAGVINRSLNGIVTFVSKVFEATIGSGVEKAVKWAIGIANDNSHGYDQASRWGNPDYDCSALVISAFEQAGIPLKSKGAYTTANLYEVAKSMGFADVTSSVNRGNASGLKRGDILLSRGHHTAIYIGNGQVVQASQNELGGITGGQPGDQTGKEISVGSYYNFPWTDILRYAKHYKGGVGRFNFANMFPKYAAGGFPEDGFFFANRHELVGEFSNGKTAVANNDQIITGIENGVYRGMMRAQGESNAEIGLLEEILSAIKDGKKIVVDGRELVNIYDSRKSRNGFSFGGAV